MNQSNNNTLEFKFDDSDPESQDTLSLRIEASDFAISIYPQGHGDFRSDDGQGCPLHLELYQGHLRVIAFPNINTEVPQIIYLTGAREDRRQGIKRLHEETPLQIGRRFHEFLSEINQATGKKFTMKEAADANDVNYATFRNLEALWRCPEDNRLNNERRAT